jgi:hypothetical protein
VKEKLVVALVVLLAGCTEEMHGFVQNKSRQSLGAAVLIYKTPLLSTGTATFTVTMPDGEVFQGDASDVYAENNRTSQGYEQNDEGGWEYTTTYSTEPELTETVGSALSDRGNTMQCVFELDGEARCDISDGRVLYVRS